MPKQQHVTPRSDGKWQVIGAGNQKPSHVTPTQYTAIGKAREIAIHQTGEVVIHGKDGRFREKNSYGNDPYPPKG